MNERIKELILEAGFPKFDKMYVVSDGEELEKFAELIVERCLSMIENEAAQYAEPVWEVELLNDIRDHFGIEE